MQKLTLPPAEFDMLVDLIVAPPRECPKLQKLLMEASPFMEQADATE